MGKIPSQKALRTLVWTPWTVITLITGLRIFVRVKLRNSGPDDFLIVLAWLCYTASMASGQAGMDSTDKDEHERTFLAAWLAGYLSLVWTKVGVALALLRLLENIKDWRQSFLKINLWLFALLSIVGLVGAVTLTTAECNSYPYPSGTYICVSWSPLVKATFLGAWTVHGAILDLAFSFIAMFTVFKLKLAMRKKVGLIAVFSLGCAACPFAILRQFSNFYWFIPATTLEIALVNTGASIPTLMPLYEFWKHGKPLTPRHVLGNGPTAPSGTDGQAYTTPRRLEASRRNADESTVELMSVHTKDDNSH